MVPRRPAGVADNVADATIRRTTSCTPDGERPTSDASRRMDTVARPPCLRNQIADVFDLYYGAGRRSCGAYTVATCGVVRPPARPLAASGARF